LAQHVIEDLTQDKLARLLYHSLRDKILPLADDLIVYPNHGAGSACGKNMSKETTDTLGNQKKTNYASRNERRRICKAILTGLTTSTIFSKNVLMNIQGYDSLDTILENGQKAMM
jgi:glyoxylase-like metal-dependent hydrolase (beta-lactamase superfamily II)